MLSFLQHGRIRRVLLIALPLALMLTLLFPVVVSAHAILLRSDPPEDAVLSTPPRGVRMWFSEDLNPAFSTAVVINAANKRIDNHDAHISASDTKEMDLTLPRNLPPDVYIVIWRTDSAVDGHVLRGSFIFSVANADGSVPTLSPGANPGANVPGGGNITGLYSGQLDGPTTFNLIMITLVELGAIFWVGAQLWLNFVLLRVSEERNEAQQREIASQTQARFERRFSLPTLALLLLANIGVLAGQSLNVAGGDWASAFSPTILVELATSGRFGTYWLMREITIALAMVLGLSMLLAERRSKKINGILPLANLLLGLALFIAITMSGHAAAVSATVSLYAIVIDWLHLLAAALWVGGMLYILLVYLPVLNKQFLPERARSLTMLLPYYSPLAVAGVLLMAGTGPFSAAFHLNSWNQFLDTAYGRALLVKIALVGGLLVTSALHVFILRPRLKKEFQKYHYAVTRLQAAEASSAPGRSAAAGTQTTTTEVARAVRPIAHQIQLRERRLEAKTRRLTSVLRWEPLLGVAVIVCVGLMNVFAGTLSPIAAAQQQQGGKPQPFTTTVHTTDNKFSVLLTVNPNRFGPNVFTTTITDTSTGKTTTNVGVVLYTTMLDMDMGTHSINLLADGKGHFSASGDLAMAGNWQIRIQIRTPDTTLHEATVKLVTPF